MRLESISTEILPLLKRPDLQAEVESAFAEACNLVTADGHRFSLVSQRLGDGPLNAVIVPGAALSLLSAGQRMTGTGHDLVIAPHFRVELATARRWNPIPAYERLLAWPQIVERNLHWLRTTLPLEAPPASLAAAPAYHTQGAFGSRPAIALIQSQAADMANDLLRAYHEGNLRWVMIFARRLAGLGPGLTPAGDDWLAGWMVGLRAREVLETQGDGVSVLTADVIGEAVVKAIAGQTSAFSLAFLRSAAIGAVPQAWHALIDALPDADPLPIRWAASAIMRQGATSGADMLAGFLAAFD